MLCHECKNAEAVIHFSDATGEGKAGSLCMPCCWRLRPELLNPPPPPPTINVEPLIDALVAAIAARSRPVEALNPEKGAAEYTAALLAFQLELDRHIAFRVACETDGIYGSYNWNPNG